MTDLLEEIYRPMFTRPSSRTGKKKRKRNPHAPRIGVEELERRAHLGLDLWTGKPLRGLDADQWLCLKYGMGETSLVDC